MKTWDWCYSGTFVLGTLVNKYVLTVKGFAFPAVFQSWQCVGVCLVILLESSATSKLSELNLWSAKQATRWLPLGFLVAVDLYTKSRALAQLDVPNYILLEVSLLTVIDSVVLMVRLFLVSAPLDRWWNIACPFTGSLFCLFFSALVVVLDTEAPRDAYVWAVMHCGIEATMNILIWSSVQPSRDQCFWTHLMSMALLLPVGYVLGQVYNAWQEPVAMESQFMTAFFISLLLAGAVALTHLWTLQYSDGQSKMAAILGKAMLFLLSFIVYNNQFGTAEGFTLFAGAVVCLGIQVHTLMSSQLGRVELSLDRASSPYLPLVV